MLAVSLVLLALAPAPLTLPDLLSEVGTRAPAVDVAEAGVEVARAAVGVAGAWDDPTLSVMADSIPVFGGDDADPAMITYGVGQSLNLFGRRGLARRVASARVDQARATARRANWDARAQAVGAFYDLWMNDAMSALLAEQLGLLDQMHDAALARVAVGMGMGHHDVLRAESEIAAMEAEQAALADERQAMTALLNTLRGHPVDEAIAEVALPAPAPLPEIAVATGHADGAPEVAAARAMRAEAAAATGLAEKMAWPMVMIEGRYQQRLGMPDGVGLGVTISLPLWSRDRQRSELAMTRAMARAAAREEAAMRAMAEVDVRMAWSRARATSRTIAALDTAIHAMQETIASAQSAYVTGTGDFLPYLDAVMELQALRSRRVAAIAAEGVARFELDRVAGADVTVHRP